MNTVISVKIDKATKAAAQEVAKSMGLTLSTLVNSYLLQVIATRRVELYAPERMTSELERIIGEVEADIATNGLSPAFDTVEEFMSNLKPPAHEA